MHSIPLLCGMVPEKFDRDSQNAELPGLLT